MKLRTLIILGLAVVLPVLVTAAPAAAVPGIEPPRLVLLIVVDQMRYDYLPRFGDAFTGGLHELMEQGAVFTNANLDHYPSVTAVGHATTLTGAPPSVSGIVGNDWYDRSERKNVTSVEDDATTLLGAGEPARPGSSPHRLMVSTVGDELKMTGRGARVIGLSLKDRAAILPAGRMADVALWWDTKTGAFVTSPATTAGSMPARSGTTSSSSSRRRPSPARTSEKTTPPTSSPSASPATTPSATLGGRTPPKCATSPCVRTSRSDTS
jgi:predicted AlkP superfamily pyrophosphatase or phosphodiesterase